VEKNNEHARGKIEGSWH